MLVGGDVHPLVSSGRRSCWLARSTAAADGLVLAGGGQWRLQHAARPELSGGHDVDFGGVQGEPRAQIQPEQQAKDDREHPVHLAGVTQVVADQVATDSLQDLPSDPRERAPASSCRVGICLGVSTRNASRNSPALTAAAAARLARATATALPP